MGNADRLYKGRLGPYGLNDSVYEQNTRWFQKNFADNGKCISCGAKLGKNNTSMKCLRCTRKGL